MDKTRMEQSWKRFESTGNIQDYLSFKQLEATMIKSNEKISSNDPKQNEHQQFY
ncbi:MAG: YqzL family protein [Oscillospiraceae bacterium]